MHGDIAFHTSDHDKDHIIISKQQYRYENIEREDGEFIDQRESVVASEVIRYNVQTKKLEEISLPKDIEKATFMAFDEDTYYFTDHSSPNIRVIPYELKKSVSTKRGK